jgi:transposase
MYIDVVPNRASPPAVLLRESYRDGGKVKKRTLANLSSLAMEQVEAIGAVLKGERLRPVAELFEICASAHHGHVQAVRSAMARLGFEELLASRCSPQRDLVCAMVAARILAPHTKLATTRWWATTTLASDLGVADADEDDLYAAMDWLLDRQAAIEQRLARRHLQPGSLVLYDLTSSYFEGTRCPLARLGHNRDGKKGKLQVNYGLTTDRRGCPVAVSVFAGNTADSATLSEEVTKLREGFGIETLVLVGDRGMISQRAIDEELSESDGLAWITALKGERIRALVESGGLQLGLFDERNLFELSHADYPGERLIACRNAELKKLRAHKRESLLQATEKELEKVRAMVGRGRLRGRDQIGVRVGKVVNKYKVAKHFTLEIDDDRFAFRRRGDQIGAEAALDGLYVIRTSLPAAQMSADDTVRSYKALADVERAFRSLKTIDLKVRPIHHRLADRVRSHILLCMLAYYVEWHMREAWRPLLFADEDQAAKRTRDPVAPAKRSAAAEEKALTRRLPDGSLTHSFRTLLADLATIVRNTCRTPGEKAPPSTFQIVTTPSPSQRRALDLINAIGV